MLVFHQLFASGTSYPQESGCNILIWSILEHHVLAIAAKANKILGLLKRTFGRCSEAIKTGYKLTVHPIIEYACPVWNPHQAYLSDKLEGIQRNVSRWILGPIDYTERLQYLGWMELEPRREFLSIIQFNGFSRVKLDNYLSFSRASTRSRNSKKIWKPFSRTNILKFSFWHRYIDKRKLVTRFSNMCRFIVKI